MDTCHLTSLHSGGSIVSQKVTPTYYPAQFSWKLHKNENKIGQKGGMPLKFVYLDPPLLNWAIGWYLLFTIQKWRINKRVAAQRRFYFSLDDTVEPALEGLKMNWTNLVLICWSGRVLPFTPQATMYRMKFGQNIGLASAPHRSGILDPPLLTGQF